MESSTEKAKETVWPEVLAEIRKEVGEQRFNLWLGHTELRRFDENLVEVVVPNVFIQEWLYAHFRDVFLRHCAESLGATPEVRFIIEGNLFREGRRRRMAAEQEIMADGANSRKRGGPRINPEFRLEHFVAGPSNHLSVACAKQLVAGRGGEFKPLFFHSESGLGKTHLLQAIWWGMRESGRDCCVEYSSAEEFTNQFIFSMRRNRLDAFRAKYRCVDILLIDDVHFFSDKPGLQEEFLHTYDALARQEKHVVLASDAHPKLLSRLKDSLVNRFASGMVVALGRPDYATRVKILANKAAREALAVPDEVIGFLAERYQASVRDLLGALMTVAAYARLTRRPTSLPVAREALSELDSQGEQALDMNRIEKTVAERFGVTHQELHSGRRTRRIALPRQVCMYLARELTSLSCKEIARHFGGKNHTTVVHGHRRVAVLCAENAELARVVAELKAMLGGSSGEPGGEKLPPHSA